MKDWIESAALDCVNLRDPTWGMFASIIRRHAPPDLIAEMKAVVRRLREAHGERYVSVQVEVDQHSEPGDGLTVAFQCYAAYPHGTFGNGATLAAAEARLADKFQPNTACFGDVTIGVETPLVEVLATSGPGEVSAHERPHGDDERDGAGPT